MEDSKALLSVITKASIAHVYRQSNGAAHHPAPFSLNVGSPTFWLDDPPALSALRNKNGPPILQGKNKIPFLFSMSSLHNYWSFVQSKILFFICTRKNHTICPCNLVVVFLFHF